MDIDACVAEELFAAFVRDEVAASERALMWAHAARCQKCASRLQRLAIEADEEVGTIITSNEEEEPQLPGGVPRPPAGYNRGDAIGRYLVIGELGQGGLGLVYLAYDPDLDRRVAVKILRTRASRGSDATLHKIRLMREAKAMAQFSHPNIVAVYDVGVCRGEVFIAMEYVEGLGLRQWITKHKPEWPEIRDVMVDAAKALEEAHRSGLVHRDFKPSNLLVTESRQVKVLDFGLARNIATRQDAEASVAISDLDFYESGDYSTPEPLSRAAALDEPLTQSGQLMGTPGYMAPEQYDASRLVDSRSDQFAFCVTLHEALYRRRPFRGRTFEEVREATLGAEIADPPDRVTLPEWLREVILKGLSNHPDDRFPDMAALREALTPAVAEPRKPRMMIALGFGVSAIVGAAAMFAYSPKPVPAEIQRVDQLVAEANAAAAESYYVYPPVDAPDSATAYTKVVELEGIEGAAERLADERAGELRRVFADTLIRLGDRYWEEKGGQPFATDYYSAALIFDPSRDRARERAVLTPGQLADFKARAETADFSASELLAAESLVALAEEDESLRLEKLKARYEGRAASVATASNLEALLGESATDAIIRGEVRGDPRGSGLRTKPPETEVPIAATGGAGRGDAEDDDALALGEDGEDEDGGAGERGGGASDSMSAAERAERRNQSESRSEEGARAFRSNRLDEAARLFHQALELDAGNRAALEGLANLEFERGHYREALRYGKQAARRSPKNGGLRILLGDAYYKTVDYPSARGEYERARELGHPSAAGRISRLDQKQGK